MTRWLRSFLAYWFTFLCVSGALSAYYYFVRGYDSPDQLADLVLIGIVMSLVCALAASLRSHLRRSASGDS